MINEKHDLRKTLTRIVDYVWEINPLPNKADKMGLSMLRLLGEITWLDLALKDNSVPIPYYARLREIRDSLQRYIFTVNTGWDKRGLPVDWWSNQPIWAIAADECERLLPESLLEAFRTSDHACN